MTCNRDSDLRIYIDSPIFQVHVENMMLTLEANAGERKLINLHLQAIHVNYIQSYWKTNWAMFTFMCK